MGIAVTPPMWILEDGKLIQYDAHPCTECQSCVHHAAEDDAQNLAPDDDNDDGDDWDWDEVDDEVTEDIPSLAVITGEEPWAECPACGGPIQAEQMTLQVSVWAQNPDGVLISQARHLHMGCLIGWTVETVDEITGKSCIRALEDEPKTQAKPVRKSNRKPRSSKGKRS